MMMVEELPKFSEAPDAEYLPEFIHVSDEAGCRRIVRWRGEDWAVKVLRQLQLELATDAAAGYDVAFLQRIRRLRLLSHRADFRRIIEEAHPAVMKLYLYRAPAEMVPIAIWLWSRCANRFRLHGMTSYCRHPSPQVRRHVAKSLRRLEAWSHLQMMAVENPDDPKIQWFATTPTVHRSFASRLTSFTRQLDSSHAGEVTTPSRMQYWAESAPFTYTAPKSVELIRSILHRIHRLVRWGLP
jgi:hypothetical protein